MYKPFEFNLPTQIKFGEGMIANITEEVKALGGTRPLIVTDKGLLKTGTIDKIAAHLEKSGIDYEVFDKIIPNPTDSIVQDGYEFAKSNGIDLMIAVGGGSAMDTAKAIGVLLTNGGTINEYEGLDTVKVPPTPLIAIPTTVGTGSEVTFWSVITDTDRHYKMSVGSVLLAPKVALLDPDLVETLPSHIVASTGMDALTHAIEGYTCTLSEPITDACGLYAISMIASNIRDAVNNGSKDALTNMLIGSLIAGVCFGNSDIAGVHCAAEALGGVYDTPHGIANAIMLPYIMEYNFSAEVDKYSEVAKALGEKTEQYSKRDTAYLSVTSVQKMNEDLGIGDLKSIGVKEEDLMVLAEKSAVNVSVDSNPRKIGTEEFFEIFKKAYIGG